MNNITHAARRFKLFARWVLAKSILPIALVFAVPLQGNAQTIALYSAGGGINLSYMHAITGDSAGNLYVATGSQGPAKILPDGTFRLLGSREWGMPILGESWGVAISPSGEVYFSSCDQNKIYKRINDDQFIAIAGIDGPGGYNGDNILATQAKLNCPAGLGFDASGNLYVADSSNFRIRKINSNGIITTFLGMGAYGHPDDGISVSNASIPYVYDFAFDHNGQFFYSEQSEYTVRTITPQGKIGTVAGTIFFTPIGFVGDGGPAVDAKIIRPRSLAFNDQNELLIADSGGNRIRKVDHNGIITTIVGNGTYANTGDNGAPLNAGILTPSGLYLRGADLFVSSNTSSGARVRRVGPAYVPGPPRIYFASSQNTAGLGFCAPNLDGGSDITGYTVTSYPSGGVDLSAGTLGLQRTFANAPCLTGYVHEIVGLNPGQSYTFTVHAINRIGAGAESAFSTPVISTIPSLSISDATPITEGNNGTRTARFTVTLSKTSNLDVSFNVSVGNEDDPPELYESDVIPVNFLGTIPAGQTSLNVDISVRGDTMPENDEYFPVYISNPTNATIADFSGYGTILDDELIPLLSVSDFAINEGNAGIQLAPFFVQLSRPAPLGGVSFTIEAATIPSTGNAASAGSDFYPARLTQVLIPAGELFKIFYVKVVGDKIVEPDERYIVKVSDVTGAFVEKPAGSGKILNDDNRSLQSGPGRSPGLIDIGTRYSCLALTKNIVDTEKRVAAGKLEESSGIKAILAFESAKKKLACPLQ